MIGTVVSIASKNRNLNKNAKELKKYSEKALYRKREKERYLKKKEALLYSMNNINGGDINRGGGGGGKGPADIALADLKRRLRQKLITRAPHADSQQKEASLMKDIGIVRTIQDQEVSDKLLL